MRFGLYLMRRGVLTSEQLVEALEEQLDRQPQLGQLAIAEGMLSVREVLEVLRAQSTTARERFGDAAMDLGLLDRAQVAHLLMLQADQVRPLHEVLVDVGAIDAETVQQELSAFRRDRERSGAGRGGAPSLEADVLAREAAFESTPQLAH